MTGARDRRAGWTVSLGLHLILALLFLVNQLHLKPFELNFTPIEFAPLTGAASPEGSAQPGSPGGGPLVELPRRPMLDETSPLLRLPDSDRQAVAAPVPEDRPHLADSDYLTPNRRVDLTPSLIENRERAPVRPLPLSDELLTGQRPDALSEKIAAENIFDISWEGPVRVKLAGELPAFPPELNRAATVRLEIVVTPSGDIANITPVTKGLPELEKVSLEALRTWRFNRLDRALAQENQKGVVTFKFELK
ncbi:MAG: energy transducer TonB [Calditrichota bacterium]